MTRRRALLQSGAAAANALPLLAHAAQKKYSARDAQDAIAAIRNARISLNDLDAPIAKGDFEGAAATLAASPIGDFERDATIIIQAPVLAAEDKKAIGTIRRYGVAAEDAAVITLPAGLSSSYPIRLVYARPSEAHRWFWFPEMRSSEVLLFKQFDSADERSCRMLHSAVHHPETPHDAPPRRSVELRMLCLTSP